MKIAFDFESEGIQPFPEYPPKPTMLGIYEEGKDPYYMSWGHPSGNNCTEAEARLALTTLWLDPEIELLAHNLAFDLAIAHKHWGLPIQRQGKFHDTMTLLFLLDPHAQTTALKPSAEKHLGLPPDEQDAVRNWIISHGLCRANAKDWGAHISKVPAEIVGPYCQGDVVRTMELFNVLRPKVEAAEMWPAYEVEMRLTPIMLRSTFEGIYIDLPKLEADVNTYSRALATCESRIHKELGGADFNIDSDAELAAAIDAKYASLKWVLTPTGKKSTSKANLEITLAGVEGTLGALLQYRASVATCLNTFMKPWLIQAKTGDGRIRCQWNTTRSDQGGARTGRLSSTPSLMNIPTLTSAKFARAIEMRNEFLSEYPELPNVRSHISAAPGHKIISIDYSAQELRVLAHMEGDKICQAFIKNPLLDMHQAAADMVSQAISRPFSRKFAKTVAFSILYGSGIGKLAESLSCDYDTAKQIKAAYLETLPGIKNLQKDLTARGKTKQAVTTWGGRRYYCEEAKWSAEYGRVQSFEYKLLNYLIQGSSADITKAAILEYDRVKQFGHLRVTVHDQLAIEVPDEYVESEAEILGRAMMSPQLDCPLTVDASFGQNLHELTDIEQEWHIPGELRATA